MDVKTSVFKRKPRMMLTKRLDATGERIRVKVKGGWMYRIRYIDDDGQPQCKEKGFFDLKSQAQDELNAAVVEIRKSGGKSRKGERMTFDDLADICEETIYQPAVIVEGKKDKGVHSRDTVIAQIKNLRKYFGKRLINSISTSSLHSYRDYRLKPQPSKKPGGEPRQLKSATVNRELSAMRRMMRHALAKGWIIRDIFFGAEIIKKEEARTRILQRDEEIRLLAACEGTWTVPYERTRNGKVEQLEATFTLDNRHLRAMIIVALDTGMRRGEIFKLRWDDIDFEGGIIRVLAGNTKTETGRIVPLSGRVIDELEKIRSVSPPDRPFPFTDIKRSFATAKRLAGIDDLRFHDLRATAGDRMSRDHQLSTVSKILGHAMVQTTMKHYVGNEIETVLEVKKWLDRPVGIATSDASELIN